MISQNMILEHILTFFHLTVRHPIHKQKKETLQKNTRGGVPPQGPSVLVKSSTNDDFM